jgi:hypothetical protein
MDDMYLKYPPVEDMDRREIEDFIKELDLDINPEDYKDTKKLRDAISDLIGLG